MTKEQMRVKLDRTKRLLAKEAGWTDAGTGDLGRNKGKLRSKKKARQHQSRMLRMDNVIKVIQMELGNA